MVGARLAPRWCVQRFHAPIMCVSAARGKCETTFFSASYRFTAGWYGVCVATEIVLVAKRRVGRFHAQLAEIGYADKNTPSNHR